MKAKYLEHYKRRRQEYRRKVEEIKSNLRCAICKSSEVLIFHHRQPSKKLFGLSSAASRRKSAINKEISKCDVLCSSCHSLVHAVLRGLDIYNRPEGFNAYIMKEYGINVPEIPEERICSVCGIKKDIDEFPTYRNTSNNKCPRQTCKKCVYDSMKDYNRKYSKEYHKKHPEMSRKSSYKYFLKKRAERLAK